MGGREELGEVAGGGGVVVRGGIVGGGAGRCREGKKQQSKVKVGGGGGWYERIFVTVLLRLHCYLRKSGNQRFPHSKSRHWPCFYNSDFSINFAENSWP